MLLCALALNAQNERYVYRRLGIEQGLSQGVVNDMAQDQYGFMWFATNDGLNKYTAEGFRIYRPKSGSELSLSENNIKSLCVHHDSCLWIGTATTGINVLDLRTGQIRYFNSTNSGLSNNNIRCMSEDTRHRIWIGTSDGVNCYDPQTTRFTVYHKPFFSRAPRANLINKIVEDSFRRCFWVYVDFDGVYKLEPGSGKPMQRVVLEDDLMPNTINSGVIDQYGTVWAATGNGIYYLEMGKSAFKRMEVFNRDWKYLEAACMLIDGNYLWTSIYTRGLCYLDIRTKQFVYQRAYSVNDQLINPLLYKSMLRDASGLIWMGSNGDGVERVDPKLNFQLLSFAGRGKHKISSISVRAIMQDPGDDDIFWIGGYGGLDKYSRKQGLLVTYNSRISSGKGLKHDAIYSLFQVSKDTILVGSEGGGLYVFNPRREQFRRLESKLHNQQTLSGDFVFQMLRNPQGKIWIGTDNGLSLFDPSTFRFKRLLFDSTRVNRMNIYSLFYLDNILVLCTSTGIITWAEGDKQPVHVPVEGFKASKYIFYSAKQSGENFWIATDGFGLLQCKWTKSGNRLKLTLLKEVNEDHGLSNNVVYGMVSTPGKELWVSTNNGLNQINERTGRIRQFVSADGLQSNEFNKGAVYTGHDGIVYFGGIHGITFFNPRVVRKNRVKSQVSFTGLTVIDQAKANEFQLNNRQKVYLNYRDNLISVNFTVTDYHAVENNRYAFVLYGLNDKYRFIGKDNSITFTKLDPGEYTLKVIGANSDGYWNLDGREIDIVVVPPFWLKWWFRVGVLVLAGFSIMLIGVYRTQRVRRRAIQLERQVMERTVQLTEKNFELDKARQIAEKSVKAKADFLAMMSHEIRTPMNGVVGMVSLLQGTPLNEEQRNYLDTIRFSSDNLLRVINDILDFSKIDSGKIELNVQYINLHEMFEHITDLFYQVASDKGIQLCLLIEGNVPEKVWCDEMRMSQVIGNLLNNAIKFTRKGYVMVQVQAGEPVEGRQEISVAVKDTGTGIPAERLEHIFEEFIQADISITREYGGTGLGLSIVSRLAALMHGTVSLESELGKGSTFTLHVPLKIETGYTSLVKKLKPFRVVMHEVEPLLLSVLTTYFSDFGGEMVDAEAADPDTLHVYSSCELNLTDPNSIKELSEQVKGKRALVIIDKQRYGDWHPEGTIALVEKPVHRLLCYQAVQQLLEGKVAPRLKLQDKLPTVEPRESKLRILVAEDNEVNKAIIFKMLERNGYKADYAPNGKAVLESVKQADYDIILMDIQMPQIDGVTATRKILEAKSKAHTPRIIALTASVVDDEVAEYYKAGMVDVIAKPVSIEELTRKLAYWSEQVEREQEETKA